LGKARINWRFWSLRVAAAAIGLLLLLGQSSAPVTAGANERTLWLYHTHTHEEAHFTYWKNGQYDPAVLAQMNIFLADWRNHKPTHMDPHLFDLLWAVYQDLHASQPYNIVSAYRTPETNAYLRSRSSLVAEHSQHMLGHAMDVFIPGVNLETLRETALKHQVGGVGYYPTSGSPFVHMDVGSVRAWPRLTRAQLVRVFPDGRTLHLPVDGTPLSDSGRLYAQAQWNQCHMVPCGSVGSPLLAPAESDNIQLASLDPAERSVTTINITAPTPMARPTDLAANEEGDVADPSDDTDAPDAIVPFEKSAQMMVATRDTLPVDSALGAISTLDHSIPHPMDLLGSDQVLTAYAPEMKTDPGAEQALRMIIARETTATAPAPVRTAALTPAPTTPAATAPIDAGIRPAAVGGTNGLNIATNFFDLTWTAVSEAGGGSRIASTLTNATIDREPLVGLKERNVDLVAPEIDHVNETLATPLPMTDVHYAALYEPEGYLDNSAELGQMAGRIHLESDLNAPPRYDRFIVRSPPLVAARG
jgi:uncharacterized protein YcbK (DUF882 family)